MDFDKIYEPQRLEQRWADHWVSENLYSADPSHPGTVFSLVIPPPNVTGSLHMGHMLEHTEIDATIRWRRMMGDNVLWLPGTDHAGIATQKMVEDQLAREGKRRVDMSRDEFEARVWAWKEQYGNTIYSQMLRVGASCDWTRARFTMDPGLSRAVREVFVRLYEKGLIYRGPYMVNWDPVQGTAVSDLEVDYEELPSFLWQIRYPVEDSNEFLVVATTRPETMLGDTAVAINAKDPRYLHLHGKHVLVPLMNRRVPIILDDMADPEFGTGVVKITPAHDPNDFEAGKRHNLPQIQVIGFDARMTSEAGEFAGLDRFEARKAVVAKLQQLDLIEKIEDYKLRVGKGQRSKAIVEPLISTQWFLSMKPLAEPAIRAVESGEIQFIPENWTKTYYEWMYNIRDWCVSRQLWWGHRIPAWHCKDCGEMTVARDTPTACPKCSSSSLEQETDVLDTWFSSALWPFSTMGWPDPTPDLKTYYPTSLLITGFDILFFWVARMIMMGIEHTGQVPFREVYIHGLVRDAEKQKMSKTKGNTIDPLEVTAQYGTDAIRMALLQGAAPGTDIVFSKERMESARNFANKIWNASRLIFINMERSGVAPWIAPEGPLKPFANDQDEVPIEDRWIFSRLNRAADLVHRALAAYRYHEAAQTLWQFFWGEFCDWYLEVKKLRLEPDSGLTDDWKNLLTAYERSLRLLHPVMPFLTEELFSRLAEGQTGLPRSISLASYPRFHALDEPAESEFALMQDIITAAREMRADFNAGTADLTGTLYLRQPLAPTLFPAIEKLARLTLTLAEGAAPHSGAVHLTPQFDLALDVPQDKIEARKTRLVKDIANLEKQVAHHQRQLSDDGFTSKAPAHILDSMRAKLAEYQAQLDKSRKALT
jgi:valyl-tRNA synthetase